VERNGRALKVSDKTFIFYTCLPRHPGPARAEGEVNDTDARLWQSLAPHQSRSARDAARALERGGLAAGQGRVRNVSTTLRHRGHAFTVEPRT